MVNFHFIRPYLAFFLLLSAGSFSCNRLDVPTVIEGKVLYKSSGLPANGMSVRIFGIKETLMSGNIAVITETLQLNGDSEFTYSFTHPEVSFFTIMVINHVEGYVMEANEVDCSPYACLDLPAGRRYELEIRVEE